MSEEKDETLARRAAGGCRASFALLLERHYDRVYRLAWRWTGSQTAGQDIAQDVAAKLARAIRTYRADAAFSTWLHRIAYTTTVDFLRSNQRTVAVDPSEIVRLIDSASSVPHDTGAAHDDLWNAALVAGPAARCGAARLLRRFEPRGSFSGDGLQRENGLVARP